MPTPTKTNIVFLDKELYLSIGSGTGAIRTTLAHWHMQQSPDWCIGATRLAGSARLDDAAFPIEIADCLDEPRDRVDFDGGKVRVPAIDDQHDARLLAAVPRLMLERVVERDALAFLPGVVLAADADRAVVRNDQRQMRDDARVRHAVMRQDVRAGRENGEADFRRVRADAHERQR